MYFPTVVLEPTKGEKSGICASSTGVGTATMTTSAAANSGRIRRHFEAGCRLQIVGTDFAGGIEVILIVGDLGLG